QKRGEVDSPKPPVSPDQKTQAQWKIMFDKKDFEEFGCKEEWDALPEKDLLDIFAYLHGHASDSPSPAKCK
ncbi:cytochrome c family protein, partial [Desulfobacterales bacterium HSG17]|nr:cytochrome c family protein [Desulfobacterales bacterium HSG17]